jgi:hypothetical protein
MRTGGLDILVVDIAGSGVGRLGSGAGAGAGAGGGRGVCGAARAGVLGSG